MFENREQAGKLLAKKLEGVIKSRDYVVIALLRGGIVLGKKIADYFNVSLIPMAVKKIGAPLNPELGIGAVTFDKTFYFNENLIEELNISSNYRKTSLEDKCQEVKGLQEQIEKKAKRISLKDKNAIIVDDGVATGNTVICASLYLKKQKAKRIILAVPVIGKESLKIIKEYFDRVVFLKIADNLSSVSQFYKEFPQVEDNEAMMLL